MAGATENAKTSFDYVAELQRQLWPHLDFSKVRMPTAWSSKDTPSAPPKLEISPDGLTVRYIGPGNNDADAASLRSDHPIPAGCGVYYYEATIKSKGREGFIGVGVSAGTVSLDRLPGWEKASWGYHGDDGHSFRSHGTGTPYGPTYTTGDVIGCCVNFIDNTCFFTKNGVHLGTAFSNVRGELYPVVGMRTLGETVEVNFGQKPFVFNIVSYMQEVRANTQAFVRHLPLPAADDLMQPSKSAVLGQPPDEGAWEAALHELVVEYLVHSGYTETAEALVSANEGMVIKESAAAMRNRHKIRRLILDGDADGATVLIRLAFPRVMNERPELLYMLKRLKFIEMVREGSARGTDKDALEKLFLLGQELRAMAENDSTHLATEEYRADLEQVFGLLAYADPEKSPIASLLGPDDRQKPADGVNIAILELQDLPSQPALDTIYRQTQVCLRKCVREDIGAASFISMDSLIN